MAQSKDIFERVDHHYADNDGVKIHYVTAGEGPPVLFVHGFPDFWHTWNRQMDALSGEYRCAALDLRGYNKSDKPKGQDNYAMELLVGDVLAVIEDMGAEQVNLVGHDWGGYICWWVAMLHPEKVKNLVIMNLCHPHPRSGGEISEEERKGGEYRKFFRQENTHEKLDAQRLARMAAGEDDEARERLAEALRNSDFEAMLNYYKETIRGPANTVDVRDPNNVRVKPPVLQFHGLDDMAVHKDGLRDTWNFMDQPYTLVTVPGAGHWVHREASDLVTNTMKWWLRDRQ